MNRDNLEHTVVLYDEDGNEIKFAFLDQIAYGGAEFAVLLSTDEVEEPELVILKIETDADGEETLADVEDEAELDAVFAIFEQRHAEDFDFAD